MKKIWIYLISLFLIVAWLLSVLLTVALPEHITPYVCSFAVTASDELYVGTTGWIRVYKDGAPMRLYFTNTLRDYRFVVDESGNIILATKTRKYMIDPEGFLIETVEGQGKELYRQHSQNKHSASAPDGSVYKLKNSLGRTRIVNDEGVTVYQISWLSAVVKWLLILCPLAIVILGTFKVFASCGYLSKKRLWNMVLQ